MTVDAYICDYVRTPIGRYGGALAGVRADDLAALPIRELLRRHAGLGDHVDEVVFGCANQAGEDNRNLARMALLLAGLPDSIPGATVNRLCASGMDAVAAAARAIKSGEIDLAIAGGAESMTRAPLVMGKAETAFQRSAEVFDTTIGWRFVNPQMKKSLWRRFDAGNRADRRRRASGFARGPGRLRAALAGARGSGAGEWDLRSRDRSGRNQGPQGRSDPLRERRASARGYNARCAGEIAGESCGRTAA